ncbi:hypothetical protein BCR35DRAFT_223522 [Leucosporidium creatinivorum]|uniref:Uncharacterized protein n=1 Tax=Leucosporidium creatinivorum TaxID=106004 RepID=A0A1Y2D6U2_9BASI|nr:hypothetical protein BCR35DRAFT_223522 [Leucosporidium creatinivorum]
MDRKPSSTCYWLHGRLPSRRRGSSFAQLVESAPRRRRDAHHNSPVVADDSESEDLRSLREVCDEGRGWAPSPSRDFCAEGARRDGSSSFAASFHQSREFFTIFIIEAVSKAPPTSRESAPPPRSTRPPPPPPTTPQQIARPRLPSSAARRHRSEKMDGVPTIREPRM